MQGDLTTRVSRGTSTQASLDVEHRGMRRLLVVEPTPWLQSGDERRVNLQGVIDSQATRRDVTISVHAVTDVPPRRLDTPDLRSWVIIEPTDTEVTPEIAAAWDLIGPEMELGDFHVQIPYSPGETILEGSTEVFAREFGEWLDEILSQHDRLAPWLTQRLEDLESQLTSLLNERNELEELSKRLQLEVEDLERELEAARSLIGSLRARINRRGAGSIAMLVATLLTTAVGTNLGATMAPAPVIDIPAEMVASTELMSTCNDIIRYTFGLPDGGDR